MSQKRYETHCCNRTLTHVLLNDMSFDMTLSDLSDLAKYSIKRSVVRSLCDSFFYVVALLVNGHFGQLATDRLQN